MLTPSFSPIKTLFWRFWLVFYFFATSLFRLCCSLIFLFLSQRNMSIDLWFRICQAKLLEGLCRFRNASNFWRICSRVCRFLLSFWSGSLIFLIGIALFGFNFNFYGGSVLVFLFKLIRYNNRFFTSGLFFCIFVV